MQILYPFTIFLFFSFFFFWRHLKFVSKLDVATVVLSPEKYVHRWGLTDKSILYLSPIFFAESMNLQKYAQSTGNKNLLANIRIESNPLTICGRVAVESNEASITRDSQGAVQFRWRYVSRHSARFADSRTAARSPARAFPCKRYTLESIVSLSVSFELFPRAHGEIKPQPAPWLDLRSARSSPPHTSRRYGKIAWHVWTNRRTRRMRVNRGKNPCE